MMVLEVNEKEEQMVSTAYTTQKGFYKWHGIRFTSCHVSYIMYDMYVVI